jgi:phosphoribosylamine--glycine ligase / phosphoribosylformylglycinamidine cyclo-ligase
MKFLILGSGGREVGIAKCLTKHKVYCISNYLNKQMDELVEEYIIFEELYNTFKLRQLILEKKPEIVIIGSEKFLESGIVDILVKNNIGCIGPKKRLADIELSKTFARKFLSFNNLEKYNPKYDIVHNYDKKNLDKLFSSYSYDFVLKDDGLCGGKGVKLFNYDNYDLAFPYSKSILEKNNVLLSNNLLVEEKLYGEEYVIMSFVDGDNIKHMPVVKDFKKIELGSDVNTGSMGCLVQSNHTLPFLNEDDIKESQDLNENIMKLLSKGQEEYKGHGKYKGILYGSFMKTSEGIKLIEYNARFGDPECLVIFAILKTDLGLIFEAIVNGTLDKLDIEYENKNVICKYLVPPGYPDVPLSNIEFKIKEVSKVDLLQAGLKYENNKLLLTGSRSLAVISKGDDFMEVYQNIENEIYKLKGSLYYREDIGKDYNLVIKNNLCKNNNIIKTDLYSQSGVNIEEGNKVVDMIKTLVMDTYNEYVMGNWGDFGGIFDIMKYISDNKLREPILINSMDGVGTKSILSIELLGVKEGLKSLGQDIVNHSVNDIIVKGGKPLYFLDYVASDNISAENMVYLLEGMSKACKENECVLIGGETAEMPSVYQKGHYDIVGNITGILEKNKMINGKRDIKEGDCIFGLLSLGPQTNGYSLIRHILENMNKEELLVKNIVRVHKSFLREINTIRNKCKINGLCHITGGGFYENIPRVLPKNLGIEIELEILEPFKTLMKLGDVSNEEMYRVFNCGYGMLVFVDSTYRDLLESVFKIKYLGKVVKRGINKQILIN